MYIYYVLRIYWYSIEFLQVQPDTLSILLASPQVTLEDLLPDPEDMLERGKEWLASTRCGRRKDPTHPTFKSCLHWMPKKKWSKTFPKFQFPKLHQNFQDTTRHHHCLVEDEIFHFLSPLSTFGKAKVGIGGAMLHWIWVLPTHSPGGVCSISPETWPNKHEIQESVNATEKPIWMVEKVPQESRKRALFFFHSFLFGTSEVPRRGNIYRLAV